MLVDGQLISHERTKLGKRIELYYEGFVEDFDSMRQKHHTCIFSVPSMEASELEDQELTAIKNKKRMTHSAVAKKIRWELHTVKV